MKKKLTIGILAHVDAGKTTLSEALLYLSGRIRTLGRVDHRNTYLDTNIVERERGITIFSKQARFSTDVCDFILLDTPGHADFSAETERTLALLDYAILVISAPDGVQNHTRVLWQLLEYYRVPTFLFVNKTDIAVKTHDVLEAEISEALSSECVSFFEGQSEAERDEKLALVDERFLEAFLAQEPISDGEIASLVAKRLLFPCLYGSALRMTGIAYLLDCLGRFTLIPQYDGDAFGAAVYKIARAGNTRLTYMKVTSGMLRARDEISYLSSEGERYSEKISQIRLYSGEKFEQVESVSAGEICAVSGLSATYAGQGLGMESDTCRPVLSPVLSYCLILPPDCNVGVFYPKLKELEEEEPSLHLYWNAELSQIEARLMGDIQIDLLKRLIRDRFGVSVELGAGKILYKEQIMAKTVGIGHFEPLRHYAEVQLLMEPQPTGTGLVFDSRISEDDLDLNWQRLILSHLYEKTHRGILTGAPLTDTKITLVAGRAHQKHTEGGDFREATYRAVRQGLMKAGCVLLEPYYQFRLEVPNALVGRAMSDLQMKSAAFQVDSSAETHTVLVGKAPVAELCDYAQDVISYTRGAGTLSCVPTGYFPCHNTEQIVSAIGYDPVSDIENTPHSVFCSHGAGEIVPWNEVDERKHLDANMEAPKTSETILPRASTLARKYRMSDEDFEAMMLKDFGPVRLRRFHEPKTVAEAPSAKAKKAQPKPRAPQKDMYILDGYNLIYAWDSLKSVANYSLEHAREVLMDVLSDYVAYTKTELVLVFDAYRVKDGRGSDFMRDGYRVVYTAQDETADAFIERMMYDLGPNYRIRLVTGDRLLQFSAVHSGISRMTVKEFEEEIARVSREITAFVRKLSES